MAEAKSRRVAGSPRRRPDGLTKWVAPYSPSPPPTRTRRFFFESFTAPPSDAGHQRRGAASAMGVRDAAVEEAAFDVPSRASSHPDAVSLFSTNPAMEPWSSVARASLKKRSAAPGRTIRGDAPLAGCEAVHEKDATHVELFSKQLRARARRTAPLAHTSIHCPSARLPPYHEPSLANFSARAETRRLAAVRPTRRNPRAAAPAGATVPPVPPRPPSGPHAAAPPRLPFTRAPFPAVAPDPPLPPVAP